MSEHRHPLAGWVVADLSTGIAGGYCTKILVDGGADVVKVEPPGGDPLRSWTASGAPLADGEDGALFRFLSAGKRSVVVDPSEPAATGDLDDLLAAADVAVWAPGGPLAEVPVLAPPALQRRHPHLIVVSISPFGLGGPWAGRAATEFTLQAWSGGVVGLGRGDPARAPAHVGGQIGWWLAGAYAAAGALVARRRHDGATGEIVDVSVLEAAAMCLTYYPVNYLDGTGRPFRARRAVVTPGVAMAVDGMVAVGVGTGQQWLDFCVMVGHPEWTEDPRLFRERGHLRPEIDAWFAARTTGEILELADAFRLPSSPIANGAILPQLDHFVARGTFVGSSHGFVQPGPPLRTRPALLRAPGAAPRLGAHTGHRPAPPQTRPPAGPASTPPGLPFAGLRVLDVTAFWAGPSCTHVLALLGAEVIHLESVGRPDGSRMLGAPMTEDRWWERSPIFASLNTNKKSVTLDFRTERGLEILRRLIATCDVLVENFTPRVLDQAGLSFEGLRALREDIIVVRMPGFGLDGPWRDKAAFAYTIEDASGLTWMTGYEDEVPLEPYSVGDPNAGIHALLGLLLALAHRDRTGEGVDVEAAMVDAAVNVAAEQVVEFSAYGSLLGRAGNRGPAGAPQNLYRTADTDERGGNDCWVAIAVASDAQWEALVGALGRPPWASGLLATESGRVAEADLIDRHLVAWCATRGGDEIVDLLWPAGVPVARVVAPHRQGELAQLQARGFFEILEHPVSGPARYSTLPMQFSRGPAALHRRHAPLLGEHNAEVLGGLGLDDDALSDLERQGVIGRVPAGTGAK